MDKVKVVVVVLSVLGALVVVGCSALDKIQGSICASTSGTAPVDRAPRSGEPGDKSAAPGVLASPRVVAPAVAIPVDGTPTGN